MSSYRLQLVPVILGGGDSPWSTVSLAQSYARLVTGVHVDARMVMMANPPAAGALDLSPFARRTVTHAMTLVTEPGGTAASAGSPTETLRATIARARTLAAARGETLGFFSKTGTPEIEFDEAFPRTRAINALIRAYRVRLGEDGTLQFFQRGEGQGIAIAGANRSGFLNALTRDAEAMALVRRAGSTPVAVAQRLMEDVRDGIGQFYQIDDNILVSRYADHRQTRMGKVYVFVIARYASNVAHRNGGADNGDGRPIASYVVAVNIESRNPEMDGPGNPAADFAAELLQRRLLQRLMREPLSTPPAQPRTSP